jgi:DNA-binding PadR family transcriptional regulator
VTDAVGSLTPLGAMLLALLREDDMHPYEMIRLLRQRHDDRLIAVTNGTVYHTISRLERRGFVDEVGVDRAGNRPERTTYTLTADGSAAVEDWVRRELPRVDHPVEFRIALAEAHNLERDEVVALLRRHRDALASECDLHRIGLAKARERRVPGQFLLEVERQELLLTTELAWIDGVIARIADPGFAWGADQVPQDHHLLYLAQRKAAQL